MPGFFQAAPVITGNSFRSPPLSPDPPWYRHSRVADYRARIVPTGPDPLENRFAIHKTPESGLMPFLSLAD